MSPRTATSIDLEELERLHQIEAELERLQHNFTLADVARQEAEAEVERLRHLHDGVEDEVARLHRIEEAARKVVGPYTQDKSVAVAQWEALRDALEEK